MCCALLFPLDEGTGWLLSSRLALSLRYHRLLMPIALGNHIMSGSNPQFICDRMRQAMERGHGIAYDVGLRASSRIELPAHLAICSYPNCVF